MPKLNSTLLQIPSQNPNLLEPFDLSKFVESEPLMIELKIGDHAGAIVLASQVAFMRNERFPVRLGSLCSLWDHEPLILTWI